MHRKNEITNDLVKGRQSGIISVGYQTGTLGNRLGLSGKYLVDHMNYKSVRYDPTQFGRLNTGATVANPKFYFA